MKSDSPKSSFELGVQKGRQALAKQLLAITTLNDAEQARAKVKALAESILNTED